MTLILSYAARGYVCQVSDRLVSKRYPSGATPPHDPWFNKQVLYMARDGLFTVGFSGLGYIEGIPTDQWIASILANEPLNTGGHRGGGIGTELRSGQRTFPPHWLDIGRAVERLKDACAITFAGFQKRKQTAELEAGLTIVIAGHKYKLRWHKSHADTHHIRPAIYKLAYSEKPISGVSLESFDRYWGWERGASCLVSTPELPPSVRAKILTSVKQAGSTITEEHIEEILVKGVQEVAQDPNQVVSADCLAVSLMPSRDPEVRIRYSPLPSPYHAEALGTEAPAIFSGWIVMPGFLQEPQLSLGMPKTAKVHGLSIRFEGSGGPGGIVAHTTQPRKPPPKR